MDIGHMRLAFYETVILMSLTTKLHRWFFVIIRNLVCFTYYDILVSESVLCGFGFLSLLKVF